MFVACLPLIEIWTKLPKQDLRKKAVKALIYVGAIHELPLHLYLMHLFCTGLTQLAQCDRIYIVHKYYIKVAYPKEIDEISNSNRLC